MELQMAMMAEKVNRRPMPYFAQIQPPTGPARMEMKWLMEMPVDIVEDSSSWESAMPRM